MRRKKVAKNGGVSPPRLISKFADKLLRDKAGLKTYAAGKGYGRNRIHLACHRKKIYF